MGFYTDASTEMKKKKERKKTKAWVLLPRRALVGLQAGADFDSIISLDVHPRRN
jgi:hypothetical protein